MGLLIMVALFGIIWAVFLMPQQRKMKAQREMLGRLQVGDEVLTAAGMYGQITEFDGGTVFLAIADSLEIKVTRESIAERVVYSDGPAELDAGDLEEIGDGTDDAPSTKKKRK